MIATLPRRMDDGTDGVPSLPHVDPAACRALWCGVLAKAWQDALRPVGRTYAFEENAAQHWFGSGDFFQVCQLAGFDGDMVLAAYREARRSGVVAGQLPRRRVSA